MTAPLREIDSHTINRALERYGLKLNADDLIAMAKACVDGSSLLLAKLPYNRERHVLMVHGKAVVVVFIPYKKTSFPGDPVYGRIVTVLPMEAASPGAPSSHATLMRNKLRPPKKTPKKLRKKGY